MESAVRAKLRVDSKSLAHCYGKSVCFPLELIWRNFELLSTRGVAVGTVRGAVEEKSEDSRVALFSRAALETARGLFNTHP